MHGFACSHEDWKFQLETFQTKNEVVACDLRGHGATPGRPHECSIEHYGGDVAALINNLELKAAVLVGHSMGCRVVLEANRLSPDRVAGIVLVDGSRLASGDPDAAESAARAAVNKAGYAAFAENLFRQMFFSPSPLAAVRSPLMAIQSTTRDAQLRRAPFKPGETSPWLELLKNKISDLKIEIVPGVGHFPQLEAADTVNRLIAEFAAAYR